MTYAQPIRIDCPKCEAVDALVIAERFESPVACTKCGQVFEMDWDEDADGNMYGLPIWPPEEGPNVGGEYVIEGFYTPDDPRVMGDYEERIDQSGVKRRSGKCAKCAAPVAEDQPSVIRYGGGLPGGIFHQRCAPTGGGWYGLEGEDV